MNRKMPYWYYLTSFYFFKLVCRDRGNVVYCDVYNYWVSRGFIKAS